MTYTTVSQDTWDLIAYEQLGSERHTPALIEANLEHVDKFIFRAGIELALPTITQTQSTGRLPPWK